MIVSSEGERCGSVKIKIEVNLLLCFRWISSYHGSDTDALSVLLMWKLISQGGNHFSRKIFGVLYNSITKLLPWFSNTCIVFVFEESGFVRVLSMDVGNLFPLDYLTET